MTISSIARSTAWFRLNHWTGCCLLSIGASSMTAIVTVHALLFVHQGSLKFHYNAPAKDLGGDDVNPDVGAFASVTVVSQRGRWRLMAPADASVWFHHAIVTIFQLGC